MAVKFKIFSLYRSAPAMEQPQQQPQSAPVAAAPVMKRQRQNTTATSTPKTSRQSLPTSRSVTQSKEINNRIGQILSATETNRYA